MKHINNQEEFYALITDNSNKLIIIDVYADWCGPCKAFAPTFDEFSKIYEEKAVFVKCDIDKNNYLGRQYGIQSIPTFLFFKNAIRVNEYVGKPSRQKFEELIKKSL